MLLFIFSSCLFEFEEKSFFSVQRLSLKLGEDGAMISWRSSLVICFSIYYYSICLKFLLFLLRFSLCLKLFCKYGNYFLEDSMLLRLKEWRVTGFFSGLPEYFLNFLDTKAVYGVHIRSLKDSQTEIFRFILCRT